MYECPKTQRPEKSITLRKAKRPSEKQKSIIININQNFLTKNVQTKAYILYFEQYWLIAVEVKMR